MIRGLPLEKSIALEHAGCFMLRVLIAHLRRMHELQVSGSICVISIVNQSMESLARDDQALSRPS